MSAVMAASRPAVRSEAQTVSALARLEASRIARHPAFLLGVALYVVFLSVMPWIDYPAPGYAGDPAHSGTFEWPMMGPLLVGVFGMVAANRLARGTARTGELVDAAPLSEPDRGRALVRAAALPALVCLAGEAFILANYLWRPPVLTPGWDVLTTAEKVWMVATAALAGLGGPLLGIATARWWRWPGAIIVVTVAVVLWGMTSMFASVSSRGSLLWHLSAPTTVPDTDFTDGPYAGRWFYRGSAPWRFIYVAGLCGLAGIASVAHGAVGGRRRRLQLLAVGAAVLTVTALVLSAYTGPMTVKIR